MKISKNAYIQKSSKKSSKKIKKKYQTIFIGLNISLLRTLIFLFEVVAIDPKNALHLLAIHSEAFYKKKIKK